MSNFFFFNYLIPQISVQSASALQTYKLILLVVDTAIYAPISRMSKYKYTELNYSLITARLVCRVTGQVVKLGESTTVESSAIFKTQWKTLLTNRVIQL